MSDALIAVLAVLSFLVAFWHIGWWRWFWLGLTLYLGLFEIAAVRGTGHTISQQFWIVMEAHPARGWVAGGLLLAGGIGLVVHLWWPRLRGKPRP